MPASYVSIALQPNVRNRAFKVALVVGTILAAINHTDAIVTGTFGFGNSVKVLLTYFVPYAVSTYSSIGAIQASGR